MTPERKRTIRRIGATGGFGLLVFLVAFYLSFPFDRVKDEIIARAAAQNIDLEIASAGPTFGIGIAFADLLVKTRPPAGGKPTRIPIESAKVTVSPLARLSGEMAFSASVNVFGGEVDVDWRGSKAKGETRVRAQDVGMASLPGVKEAINLPLGGTLELSVDLAAPHNRNAEANGSLTWKCAACVIGDGKEKLKIAGNALLAEGVSLPKIRLGDFVGRVAVEKGVGRLSGVHAKSPDGEILAEGEIRLADPIQNSYLDLYVQFRPSDSLLKSAEKIQLMLQLAESMGKRSDGYYGFRLSGSLTRMNTFQWSKNSPFAAAGTSAQGRTPFAKPAVPQARPSTPPAPPPGLPGPPTSGFSDFEANPPKPSEPNLPKFATDPPSGASETPPAPALPPN